jgi:hypothetical protein
MGIGRRLLGAAGWVALSGAMASCAQVSAVAPRPPVRGLEGQPANPYPLPADTAEGVLAQMAAQASIIFVGRVNAVRVPLATAGAGSAGWVEVDFAVEQWLRQPEGWTTSYVVREWAGLWRDGPRYSVGQRRLMLLHAPGPSGLSSPVDGLNGAIPIVAGVIARQPVARAVETANLNGSAVAPASLVDLRWIQARELRSAAGSGTSSSASAQSTGHSSSIAPASAQAEASAAQPGPQAVAPLGAPGENATPELGYVLSLLTASTSPMPGVAAALPLAREPQDAGR